MSATRAGAAASRRGGGAGDAREQDGVHLPRRELQAEHTGASGTLVGRSTKSTSCTIAHYTLHSISEKLPVANGFASW
eukprot:1513345-Pleurochrysis_carterae.AAC.1